MIVGMDFGTTNSGMAVFDGRHVTVLPLDPASTNPRVIRTALYVTNQQGIAAGREAVDQYFTQNVGRSVRLQKVWVGEIEVIASEVYYVEDLYVWMDALAPGRLFLSMKSALRDESYTGTVIGQHYYSLEDLIALYLSVTHLRAGRLLGEQPREVVLGRPVRFAFDPVHDALARDRLLRAAFKAGYERVYLQPEPIAAAFSYAMTLDQPQNVLVFDFGGGTLDLTVIRLAPGKRPEVLATGGIPVAGDVFDRKLSRTKLPQHFGEGSLYGPRERPLRVPAWIYDVFSDWQAMLDLQRPDNRQMLEQIARTSRNPGEIGALIALVSGNYGLQMFDEVEKAKRTLSEKVGTMIRLEGPGFDVFELVTRGQFEEIIRAEILAISDHLDETVQASGLDLDEFDVVIRTGGSSQIPVFQDLLRHKFGADKLKAIDTFSSVTAGLGITAWQVAEGELALQGYTAADLGDAGTRASQSRVPEVRLSVLQRRLLAQEGGLATELPPDSQAVLALLGGPSLVHAAPWPDGARDRLLKDLGWAGDAVPTGGRLVEAGARLLLLTSRYRFLLASASELLELAALGLTIRDRYLFVANETITAVAEWDTLVKEPLLLLVTTLGFARAYDLGVLATQIGGPTPLQFDDPPPGYPIYLAGADRLRDLVVGTDASRAVRLPLALLPNVGGAVYNRGDDEQVVGAACGAAGETLMAVTAAGYARRLAVARLPAASRLNSHGRSLLSRPNMRGLVMAGDAGTVWAVTNSRVVQLDLSDLPDEASTRSHVALRLGDGERVITLLES